MKEKKNVWKSKSPLFQRFRNFGLFCFPSNPSSNYFPITTPKSFPSHKTQNSPTQLLSILCLPSSFSSSSAFSPLLFFSSSLPPSPSLFSRRRRKRRLHFPGHNTHSHSLITDLFHLSRHAILNLKKHLWEMWRTDFCLSSRTRKMSCKNTFFFFFFGKKSYGKLQSGLPGAKRK